MLLTTALALVSTGWADRLEMVPLAGMVGLVGGLLLSQSTFTSWRSHLLSTVYGLAWIGFLAGRGLAQELSWRQRIFEVGTRIADWLQQAAYGGTSQDSLIFVLLLSSLFWILGYSAAWNTYRHRRAWLAALPFGIVATVVSHFYTGPVPITRYLGLFLLLAFLHVGRMHTLTQRETWLREHIACAPNLGIDTLWSSLVLAIMVLTLSWIVPSKSTASTPAPEIWHRIDGTWDSVEEEWQRLFSSIHGDEIETVKPSGSSLALAGSSNLSDTPVFDIAAPREGRYYWRAAVYAAYDGSRWHLPEGDVTSLAPGELAKAVTEDALRREVNQTVTSYLPGRYVLVAASQPLAAHRQVKALTRMENGAPAAFHRVLSVLPLGAGEAYTVTSRTSRAAGVDLRRAGSDYPAWVFQRYLQLPTDLPERVPVLAQEIIGGAENPYDKVLLLEAYLRGMITYDLSPPEAPPGQDYVDFLLFDSQRAYCSGYATAMVVMARSLGIPARLATGYAEGTYVDQRGVFRVRENNAHSWPEIYFPGYGWIEFEPTVSEEPLVRTEPGSTDPAVPAPRPNAGQDFSEELSDDPTPSSTLREDGNEGPSGHGSRTHRPPLWALVATTLGLFAVARAGWWATENAGLRGLPATEQAYARLQRFGRWLGRPLQAPDTPGEWARDLSAFVPKAREPIGRIVGLFVEAQFGQGDAASPAARSAWSEARPILWRHLLLETWLRRLGLSSENRE